MGVLSEKFAQYDWENKGGVAKRVERTTKRGTVLQSTQAAWDPWFKKKGTTKGKKIFSQI